MASSALFVYFICVSFSQRFFSRGVLRPFTFSFEFCSENHLSGNFSISVPMTLYALSDWGGKLRRIQIESFLCAVGFPKPAIIRSVLHSFSWVLKDHISKCCYAHVRFLLFACVIFIVMRQQIQMASGLKPAERRREWFWSLMVVALLPRVSFLFCVNFLSSEMGWVSAYPSPECSVPFLHWLN